MLSLWLILVVLLLLDLCDFNSISFSKYLLVLHLCVLVSVCMSLVLRLFVVVLSLFSHFESIYLTLQIFLHLFCICDHLNKSPVTAEGAHVTGCTSNVESDFLSEVRVLLYSHCNQDSGQWYLQSDHYLGWGLKSEISLKLFYLSKCSSRLCRENGKPQTAQTDTGMKTLKPDLTLETIWSQCPPSIWIFLTYLVFNDNFNVKCRYFTNLKLELIPERI